MQVANVGQAAAHGIDIRRDHRGQNPGHSVIAKPLTGADDFLRDKTIGVEVDICVSVHLQIDITTGSMHGTNAQKNA
jgi:hypothetical protein